MFWDELRHQKHANNTRHKSVYVTHVRTVRITHVRTVRITHVRTVRITHVRTARITHVRTIRITHVRTVRIVSLLLLTLHEHPRIHEIFIVDQNKSYFWHNYQKFSIKSNIVAIYSNRLREAILIDRHNIWFYGEITTFYRFNTNPRSIFPVFTTCICL